MNLRFYLSISGFNQGNEEGRWVPNILVLPQWFGSFSSVFQGESWYNLVCMECLEIIKPMLVDLRSTGGWSYSGWWVWVECKNICSFREAKCLQGYLFQDLMDLYMTFYNSLIISLTKESQSGRGGGGSQLTGSQSGWTRVGIL